MEIKNTDFESWSRTKKFFSMNYDPEDNLLKRDGYEKIFDADEIEWLLKPKNLCDDLINEFLYLRAYDNVFITRNKVYEKFLKIAKEYNPIEEYIANKGKKYLDYNIYGSFQTIVNYNNFNEETDSINASFYCIAQFYDKKENKKVILDILEINIEFYMVYNGFTLMCFYNIKNTDVKRIKDYYDFIVKLENNSSISIEDIKTMKKIINSYLEIPIFTDVEGE